MKPKFLDNKKDKVEKKKTKTEKKKIACQVIKCQNWQLWKKKNNYLKG